MAPPRRGKRFGWLLFGTALLVILTILFTLSSPDNVRDVPGGANMERFLIQITQVQLRVMESFPVQGVADVRGIVLEKVGVGPSSRCCPHRDSALPLLR